MSQPCDLCESLAAAFCQRCAAKAVLIRTRDLAQRGDQLRAEVADLRRMVALQGQELRSNDGRVTALREVLRARDEETAVLLRRIETQEIEIQARDELRIDAEGDLDRLAGVYATGKRGAA